MMSVRIERGSFLTCGRYAISLFLVFAVCASEASAAWVFNLTVRNVRTIASSGEVTFATVEPMLNPSNCASYEFYGILPTDNPKQALALLLTSLTGGAKISFYIADGANNSGAFCDPNGRPHVIDVMIGSYL